MHQDTNEFSLILLLDPASTAKMNAIRSQIPPSPVRVDPPHLTLLRGISSEKYHNDAELRVLMQQFLNVHQALQEVVRIDLIHNHTGKLYGESSTIELSVAKSLLTIRSELIALLQANNFIVDPAEIDFFRAHATIALSSPIASQDFSDAWPKGSIVRFSDWAILRLQTSEDNRRHMRCVPS